MSAYLTLNPPVRQQWYNRRNQALTGCTVLHSSESVFDEIGEDTGAEGVASFIQRRTTPGSYHDIVDSDSDIYLVDYIHGAFHDGTGSNNWALSLSFALRTIDWNRMSATKRKAVLRSGAKAFWRQQEWRKANGAPLTEFRLLTKAQSDAGWSGFTYHGYRDPGRRSDPGTIPPDLFPFDEFIQEIKLFGQAPKPVVEDIDMLLIQKFDGSVHLLTGDRTIPVRDVKDYERLAKAGIPTANNLSAQMWADIMANTQSEKDV